MQLFSEHVVIFLLSISLMLFTAKFLGEIFLKLKQPAIIGEILAGIILGPTVLGMFSPETFTWLFRGPDEVQIIMDGITTLAVVMLLIVTGLEVDLSIVIKQGKAAFSTGLFGLIIPFLTGFLTAYFFADFFGVTDSSLKLVFALFIGTALSISALPVIAKTLMDLKIFKTKIGLTIIAAAMFNDVVGWLIFSLILGMIGASKGNISLITTIVMIFLFTGTTIIFGRRIFDKLIPVINKKLSYPGGILNFIFILGFLGAAFTEYIGINAVFGAFILGLAIGDSVHLTEKTREMIQHIVTNIFAPLFFVSIGLRVNFVTNFDMQIVAVILVLAFIGKVVGSGIGARLGGMSVNDSFAVGFGMNSRGAMEIILGLLALQFGLINETIFVALVIMALVTSVTSAPLMSYFLKERKGFTFEILLEPQNVFYIDVDNKESAIKFLSAKAETILSEKTLSNVTKDELLNLLSKKEALSTNYYSVMHEQMTIAKPFLSIAINKEELIFDSTDKLPVRLIVLLLVPKDENELQLKLLSEIANKFYDPKKVEELLSITDETEFIERVKE